MIGLKFLAVFLLLLHLEEHMAFSLFLAKQNEIYLHDLCCCCWWWSLPIFTIISLPTLLLHDDKDSIDNSKASWSAAADDDDVGDGICCGCVTWGGFWFFWPQTFNGFCPLDGSISANNTDIFFLCVFSSGFFVLHNFCGLDSVFHLNTGFFILSNTFKLFVGCVFFFCTRFFFHFAWTFSVIGFGCFFFLLRDGL